MKGAAINGNRRKSTEGKKWRERLKTPYGGRSDLHLHRAFRKEMFEFANAFDGKGRIEIKPTDRIIDVRLEPYELLYVRLNDGMGEYLIQNRSEMISREAELKTEFVKILGKLWWHLVTLNHPKELYNKNLTLCKGYKIIEPPDLPQNPLSNYEEIWRRINVIRRGTHRQV